MPSKDELRMLQKRELSRLKFVQEGRFTLEDAILAVSTEMEGEDVAYVNELIAADKKNKN